MSAELKRRVESSGQDAPRKLPPQEISERLEALQKKVVPLKLENALEPSHSLINHVAQFVEEGRLKYLEWSRCTTRNQEVNNLKEDQFLKLTRAQMYGPPFRLTWKYIMRSGAGAWHMMWPEPCLLKSMRS